jgi:hypothetical protein
MISKPELLRKIKDIIVSEGYTMPLYMGHLLQTLPWYGLSAEMEKTAYDVLEKIRRETEQNRQTTEAIYAAVQERRHTE